MQTDCCKSFITEEDRILLDKNGFLVLEGILDEYLLIEIRNRIKELQAIEGIRAGEIGQSLIRQGLLKKGAYKSKFLIKVYDSVFMVVSLFLKMLKLFIPGFGQYLWYLSTRPNLYSQRKNLFLHEFNQMLITEAQKESKVDRLCDLVNKGKEFDIFYKDKRVLAAVKHVLGADFKLSSLNLRSPKKDCKNQSMHVDWPWAVKPGDFYACNTLWLLDDMTLENGPTRVVLGSHKKGTMPSSEMKNLKSSHQNELLITAKAGSVIILNSHTWHGGTDNRSEGNRAIIQGYFVHRSHHPQQYQRYLLLPETRNRLGLEEMRILDIIDVG